MTVLVGYLPTAEGEAAFAAGLEEAICQEEDLVVLNSPRGGALVSRDVAADDEVEEMFGRARAAGVAIDVRRRRSPVGKLFMGSSAQRILLGATRPVLAVKPK